MLRSGRLRSATAIVLSCLVLHACSGEEGDPKATLRVPGGSAEALTIAGPAGTSVVVPAGATETDVTIVLSLPRSRRSVPTELVVVGPQIRLTPDGAKFAAPIELTIPITPSALPAGKTVDDVVVVRVDADSDVFVPLPTRRDGDAVVATTEHFCEFVPVVFDAGTRPFGACLDGVCAADETCEACSADCGHCLPSGDRVPPIVVSAIASGPATSLPADATFTITFDEPILPASVSAESIDLRSSAGVVPGTLALGTGNVVTLTPLGPLPPATAFELTVLGVRDLAGNVMVAASKAAFLSATSSPVTLVATSPATASVGVHPRQDLVVTFSAPIDAATLAIQASDTPTTGGCSGSVQVADATTCFGGSVVALSATEFAIRPASSLTLTSSVTVSFGAGLADANGYPLITPSSFGFVVSPVNDFAYRIGRGATTDGNRGGVAGADAACDPTGQGTRKAFLLATTRHPCDTANCAGTETGPVDWVLATNTTYVNAAGLLLFTTDATHPIFTGFPMPNVFTPGGLNFAWGGTVNVADWLLNPGATCSDWTTNSGAQSYSVGYENSQTSGFIAGGSVNCVVSLPHLCVDQVPGTTPPTH